MRASLAFKPTISILMLVCLTGCQTDRKTGGYGGSDFITSELIVLPSWSKVEETVPMVSQEHVIAGQTRYVFGTRYPYRGSATTVIYCYEMIRERDDQWMLRAFLPINLADIHGTNLTSIRVITYEVEGEGVKLLCNGKTLLSINSVSEIIRAGGDGLVHPK